MSPFNRTIKAETKRLDSPGKSDDLRKLRPAAKNESTKCGHGAQDISTSPLQDPQESVGHRERGDAKREPEPEEETRRQGW